MTRLILMRHGNTFEEGQTPLQIGRRTDLPLTAFGREQALQMARYLQLNRPVVIFSGTLKRQLESAAIIGKILDLPVQQTDALIEIDYGAWEGLSAEAIGRHWPEEYVAWTQRAEWQDHIFKESLHEYQHRCRVWIESLDEDFPGQTVFAVTSQGFLRLLHHPKVHTGHYCELRLQEKKMDVCSWNSRP